MNKQTEIAHGTCCDDEYDPQSMDATAALETILSEVPVIQDTEQVELRAALGRVLAEDIVSPLNVPGHINSAMDGYAVRSADFPAGEMRLLKVIGNSFAGQPYAGELAPGQAVRIMTGAVIPAGADSVIMQEHVAVDGDSVRIGDGHRAGQNIRQAGEDIALGDLALSAGTLLRPADLGLLASLGLGTINCRRKVKVAFFSTGDELKSVGDALAPGDIYDSNRYTLYGMLQRLNVEITDLGVIRDEPSAVRDAMLAGSEQADMLMTSGGVSVGEADYVKVILDEIGDITFWKVAIKPGRPLAFGRVNETIFYGLPGNPVSVMVTFYQFVRPALLQMLGCASTLPLSVTAKCTSTLRKKPGRTEYQRGILARNEQGDLIVSGTGNQGSGILSSMAQGNCFIVLPTDCGRVETGSIVEVQPFDGLI